MSNSALAWIELYNDDDMGHFLTSATIHGSLLAYVVAAACWVTGRRGPRYRVLWTLACFLLWTHAASAFHFYHHWSHASAVADTAIQTEEIIGWRFGAGIWFSYALLLVWLVDIVVMWRTRQSSSSSAWQWFSVAVHVYAFFILFNGTVVFEHGAVRWGGIIGTIWLARLSWRHWRTPGGFSRDHAAVS
jgi:hypothetical protein